ncbi:MAG: hypothetical protein HOC27_08880 [Phycisphaerae bacterium]|nr:hypothetical protein [Phycisphaerae bacterium]
MKRTIVLGLLIILSMFGMAMSNTQPQSMECSSTCMLAFLQPKDGVYPQEEGRRPGRMRPDHKAPPRGEGRNQMGEGQISPMMVDHCLEVIKEIDPDLASQLSAMCEKDPEALQKIIRKQGHRLGSLIRLKESDPDLFKVKVTELKTDAEIYYVAMSLKGLDQEAPSTQKVIAELEGLVRAKTEITIKAQTLYIKRLERHLEGLQSKLADTTARLDEIVQSRMDQLLGVVGEEPVKDPSQSE